MYTKYFGFREKPFDITPDPQFFYANTGYREAYASVLSGVQQRKGLVLVSGEFGTGKTTLLHRLKEHFTPPVHCVFLSHPNIAFDELLDYICAELQITGELHGRLQKIQALEAFLMQCLQEGGTGVLLIDEAQDLQDGGLENLRLLSNLETKDEKLLQMILTGQPEVELEIGQHKWRQLRQRIAVKHRLQGVPEQEIGAFIHHRLKTVGYERQDLFSPAVVQRIAVYSKNIPRLINTICDNALLITCGLNTKTVSVDIIEEVARDLELAASPGRSAFSRDTGTSTAVQKEEIALQKSAGTQPEVNTPRDSAAEGVFQTENLDDIPVLQRPPAPALAWYSFDLPSRRVKIGLGILVGLFLLVGTVLQIQKLSPLFSPSQRMPPTAPHGESSITSQIIAKTSPSSPSAGSLLDAARTVSSNQSSLAALSGASPDSDPTTTNEPVLSNRFPSARHDTPRPTTGTGLPTTQQASPADGGTQKEQVEQAAQTRIAVDETPPHQTLPQTTSLIIQKGTTIYDIVLEAYGTYSPLALDLVKEFNPDLQDLSRIAAGQAVSLPPQTHESLLRKQEDGTYQLILASFHTAQRARALTRRVEREGYRTQTTQRRVSRNLLLHRVTITNLSNPEAAAPAWRFVNGMNISG